MAMITLLCDAIRDEFQERNHKRRILRDKLSIDRYLDSDFISEYRLNKTLFEELCSNIIPLLPHSERLYSIDPIIKILTTLNFYAGDCYQRRVGKSDDAPMSQQMVSICIEEVTTALNSPVIVAKYMKFPQTRQDRISIKSQFYNIYGLPGVIGCIDCSHVAIVRPYLFEERFFNRKLYHSLNVQMICDIENYILNVDASYGGSNHDSFIWDNSEIKCHLESLTTSGETTCLLGDAGYPLREYLMTPFAITTERSPESRYNKVHKSARSTIERTFGILKSRFRCLLAARELHYAPAKAGSIVTACSVLHNMCIRENVSFTHLTTDEWVEEARLQPPTRPPPPPDMTPAQILQRGRTARNNLVQLLDNNRH